MYVCVYVQAFMHVYVCVCIDTHKHICVHMHMREIFRDAQPVYGYDCDGENDHSYRFHFELCVHSSKVSFSLLLVWSL